MELMQKFKYTVSIPQGLKLKRLRKWLHENIGLVDEDWQIVVDLEVVEYFGKETLSMPKGGKGGVIPSTFFNISFKLEEDKVKFILYFL